MIKKRIRNFESELYVIFRILIGLLFLEHGLQKLFGLLGGTAQTPFAFMWFIGLIELVAGALIAVGMYTRLAALFGGAVMIGALIKAHFPKGVIPILNGGELAFVYLACFVVIISFGSGKWGIEKKLFGKEFF